MRCNICGGTEFGDMRARKAVGCKKCGSLERTRLLWFYLQKRAINANTKILHIAPDRGVCAKLASLAGRNYVPADLEPERYPYARNIRKIDLCAMEEWPSNEFDLIIHSHVLEHVPCNIAYSLFHLHRMLKDDGEHLCIIPFLHGKYDECFQDIDDDERQRRFGQTDHVRRFGKQDIAMHLGKIINLPERFDPRDEFPEELLREANIPPTHWEGFHVGTVLALKKHDYKLAVREAAYQSSRKPSLRERLGSVLGRASIRRRFEMKRGASS